MAGADVKMRSEGGSCRPTPPCRSPHQSRDLHRRGYVDNRSVAFAAHGEALHLVWLVVVVLLVLAQ